LTSERKNQIRTLLKGIETGDPAAAEIVNPDKYIQHNPQTHEGSEGLAALFKRLSKTNPRVNIVRAFEDGDYVFGHTEYEFANSKIGFEVFRFENDLVVEHWDNIQQRQGPNSSGHSMVDGTTEPTDLDRTEVNREFVRSFVENVLVRGRLESLEKFIDNERYVDHSPRGADGLAALRTLLETGSVDGREIKYDRIHRVLAEGDFVLVVSEGSLAGVHSSFYDLFRVDAGRIVEHWGTIESIPPQSEWKNDNGKF